MGCIFGIDIGTTSIGWAVIDLDVRNSAGKIAGMGVRIFPEARDPKGTPLNQQRRQKRMMRRQLRRRRARRRALNEALAEAGLLPPFSSTPAPRDGGTGDPWHAAMRGDPLALRSCGLNEKLDPYELGRALYHLAQRRHFRGRDLEEETAADAEQAADEKQAAEGRSATLAILRQTGQTLGQYLQGLPPDKRRRGIHATRATVADEFDRLWQAQQAHHPVLRDAAFRARIEDTVFAQRPVFWRRNTLGKCPFMPDEDLCPRGSWLSQQRRMLEKLNNLALAGGNARPLDAEERAAILEKLQTQQKVGWNGVRGALKPLFAARGEKGGEKSLRFNLEDSDKSGLPGNALEVKLAEIFGDTWEAHPHRQEIRDAIHTRLWESDYEKIGAQRITIRRQAERKAERGKAAQALAADFGVTAEQAEALSALSLPTGWEPYSTAALRRILPRLEGGTRFGTLLNGPEEQAWRDETFPDRQKPTGEILDRLPSPTLKHREEIERIASLRNPTVVRVHNELRKVVNNLIAVYGKPDLIRIELTRDVGKSKREREETQIGQRRREGQRKKAEAELRINGIAEPSRRDIDKWLLWQECGKYDPYSGEPISFDALFRTGEFDIEHIWPQSKCFDNSFGNRTLCHKAFNQKKANCTPFEAFGPDAEAWEAMKNRLWEHVKARRMSPGKAKRFCREERLPEDFANRQFTDTGYAARQAAAFLKRLWPDAGPEAPVTVQAVTGRVTAQLRKLWGLNNILSDDGEKTRADHRHHAVDALVVACADPGMTNRLSRYWQARNDPTAQPPRLDPPWPTIRADADRAVAAIVVSHRVRKKVSGPLHLDTIYGDTGQDVKTKNGTYRLFVRRKPVATLSKTEIDDIVDERVREAVRRHVEANGGDPKKAFTTFPTLAENGREIRKVRLSVKQQIRLMAPVSTGYADLGANHHIAIFRKPDGKADFEVVSLFEAARRLARREPVLRRQREDGAEFVMSLAPGDALEFPGGDRQGVWIVQGAWASGQIVLERATDAGHATTTRPNPGALLKENVRKLSVDPIGRIRPAGD